MLPKGGVRIRLSSTWARYNERYGLGGRGRKDGALEPLGILFDRDSIGPEQLENLAPLQQGLRALSGLPTLGVSLGRSRASFDASSVTTPIELELGLLSRLTVGVLVPYVKTMTVVTFDPNPERREGNVGLNPAASTGSSVSGIAKQRNSQVVAQLQAAATQLQAQLNACQANPGGSGCAALNANRTAALGVVATASSMATGIAQVYGTNAVAGSLFAPVDKSDVQLAIEARIKGLNDLFKSLLGVASDPITQTPFPAASRLGLVAAQELLTDPRYGIEAAPLETVERSRIGDIEVAAKLLLFDSFGGGAGARFDPRGVNLRSAISGVFRFGTGESDSPDDFADVGTGTGQNDIEIRSATDLLIGRRFWTSFVGRYGMQMKDRQFLRIPSALDQPFVPIYRRQLVERDLGDYYEIEVTPRYVVNGYLAFSAQYLFRRKAADEHRGTFGSTNLVGDAVTIDAAMLDAGTETTEHRVGGGITYSTVAAYERSVSGLPFEVSLTHGQTMSGTGYQPKVFATVLAFRLYAQPFGRRAARPARPPR